MRGPRQVKHVLAGRGWAGGRCVSTTNDTPAGRSRRSARRPKTATRHSRAVVAFIAGIECEKCSCLSECLLPQSERLTKVRVWPSSSSRAGDGCARRKSARFLPPQGIGGHTGCTLRVGHLLGIYRAVSHRGFLPCRREGGAMTSSAGWGLTIYLGAARQWRRRSLVTEIVLRALEGKLRGASVRCGIAGFGDAGTVRRESVLPGCSASSGRDRPRRGPGRPAGVCDPA